MALVPAPELLEILVRVRDGDDTASAALDAYLRERLRAFFRHGPWPSDEAEDLAQITLTRVFNALHKLEHEESFWPWLFTIARNVRISARARWRERLTVEAGGSEMLDLERAPDRSSEVHVELTPEVQHALASLPARQRQSLHLHLVRGLSYAQIAAVLKISEHTVRNHLAAARDSLKRSLATSGESS